MKKLYTYITILIFSSLVFGLNSCGDSFGVESNARITTENPHYEPVEPGMIEGEAELSLYEYIDYVKAGKYSMPIPLYSFTIVLNKAVIDTAGPIDLLSLEIEIDRPSVYHKERLAQSQCYETVEKIHLVLEDIPIEAARYDFTGMPGEEHESSISYYDYQQDNRYTYPAQKLKMTYDIQYIAYYHDKTSIASYINIEVPIQDDSSYKLYFQGKIDISFSMVEEE